MKSSSFLHALLLLSGANAWKQTAEQDAEPRMEEYVRSLKKTYNADGSLDNGQHRDLKRGRKLKVEVVEAENGTGGEKQRIKNRQLSHKTPGPTATPSPTKLSSKTNGPTVTASPTKLSSLSKTSGPTVTASPTKLSSVSSTKVAGTRIGFAGLGSKTVAPTTTMSPTCPPVLFAPGDEIRNAFTDGSRGTEASSRRFRRDLKSAGKSSTCVTASPTGQACTPGPTGTASPTNISSVKAGSKTAGPTMTASPTKIASVRSKTAGPTMTASPTKVSSVKAASFSCPSNKSTKRRAYF